MGLTVNNQLAVTCNSNNRIEQHNSKANSHFLQSVQIQLVLGHSASWRKKPTTEGFTHDWTVIVRGEEGQDIRHYVEKVVFYLHESFPKPKRGKLWHIEFCLFNTLEVSLLYWLV